MIARVLFVVIAVVAFALDRLTKVLVEQRLQIGERVQLVPDVLDLRHVRNRGIAFGLFSDSGSLVVGGTLVVGALLFLFLLRVDPEDLLTVVGGALITGGALGNLVDRVQQGYVTDFLHLPHWPTFNVADSCIVVGVALVVLSQLLAIRSEHAESRAAAATGADPVPGDEAPEGGRS